jgi:hypothetical protein
MATKMTSGEPVYAALDFTMPLQREFRASFECCRGPMRNEYDDYKKAIWYERAVESGRGESAGRGISSGLRINSVSS